MNIILTFGVAQQLCHYSMCILGLSKEITQHICSIRSAIKPLDIAHCIGRHTHTIYSTAAHVVNYTLQALFSPSRPFQML